MFLSLTACWLLSAAPTPVDRMTSPPLEITFKRFCGLPSGRKQLYDPRTGTFHIHFTNQKFQAVGEDSWFEVTKVNSRFAGPVVFRLTGIQDFPDSPLRLYVGGRSYELSPKRCDRALFRVERKAGVTTIEFTDKGRALLRPGAYVAFTEFMW